MDPGGGGSRPRARPVRGLRVRGSEGQSGCEAVTRGPVGLRSGSGRGHSCVHLVGPCRDAVCDRSLGGSEQRRAVL